MIALPLFGLISFFTGGGAGAWASLQWSQLGWLALSMFSSYGFGDAVFLWGTRYIGVPSALAIASAYPLWTTAAAVFVDHDPISWLRFSGLLLTVSGIVIVILSGAPSGSQAFQKKSLLKGALLAMLTSLFWAVNCYAVARGVRGLSVPEASMIRMAIALVLTYSFGKAIAPRVPIRLPFTVLSQWIWLFALEACGGTFFYIYGFAHSSLPVGATLTSLAPVISVPLAWAYGLEKFSPARTLGIGLAFFGICLLVS